MADKSPRLERKRVIPSSPRLGSKRKAVKNDNGISLMPPDPYDYGALDGFNAEIDMERKTHARRADVVVARRKLILAAFICLIFMIGEIIGAYMSNSLAILTDAAHLLMYLITLLLSLFALWMSEQPPSKKMTFGWYRLEVFCTLVAIFSIWILTGVLVYYGVERIREKSYEIRRTDIMLISAVCGVAVNFLMALLLHLYTPAHAQMCLTSTSVLPQLSPVGDIYSGHYEENIHTRVAMVHVIGDMIQSVGVLVAAIIIYVNPKLGILDPICTFLFSILVLVSTVGISIDVFKVLMEASPSNLDYTNIRRTLVEIDGVESIHSLHVWSLTVGVNAVAVHLTLANLYEGKPVDGQDILSRAQHILKAKFNLFVSTIQVETYESRDWCSYRSDVCNIDES